MNAKVKMTVSAVMLLAVLLPTALPSAHAAPFFSQDDTPTCIPNFTCAVGDGDAGCESRCRIESEGGEEEGDRGCTPGSFFGYIHCEDEANELVYGYFCTDEGEWVHVDTVPFDTHECSDRACYYDSRREDWTCWEVPSNETPCEDLDWSTSGVQCLGEYDLHVSVRVPCQRVSRIPYPRGMVIVPNNFRVSASSPAWAESWSETLDYNACLNKNISSGGRRVRNFRIGLAWGRADILPTWEIEDVGSYRGWEVRGVSWEQSSWGRTRCGPGLAPGESLPAYRVRLYTYWNLYWRVVYERQREHRKCVWDAQANAAGRCECVPERYGGGECSDAWAGHVWKTEICNDDENNDGVPDDHCWETVDSDWTLFDLRQFGYPTSYYVSAAAGPVPTALEPNPPCNGICVPVIEVQGLILNPRSGE